MDCPRVSVLIPCYNAERYIGETLESVFRQTWPNIEIVVVDDGSKDASAAVVEALARPNLKLVRQENRGQTAALNTCLAHATGDFIQYLDSDDVIDADKIEIQMRRLADRPNCVASGEWGWFQSSPTEAAFLAEEVWRDLDPLSWLAISRTDGGEMMLTGIWLIPMGIARQIGPWAEDLSLNNDAEYFTRMLLAAEEVLFCPGARFRYRKSVAGSLSRTKSKEAWLSQFRVLERCESYVRAREDSERVRRGFAASWELVAQACFPYEPELAERCVERAKALNVDSILPRGGALFRLASGMFGWRAARKMQFALRSLI